MSGLMSGGEKRGDAERPKPPRSSSTLPESNLIEVMWPTINE